MPLSAVRSGSSRSAGFTLIELTVVIVVLSVVALLVLPRLPFAREGNLKTSARELAGTLRYLQDQAIATKQYYRLHINLVDGAMKVTRVMPEIEEMEVTDSALTNLALREGVEFADLTTSDLGKVSEGEVYLDFSPLGSLDFMLFHLKSKERDSFFTVAVYPGSGRVEVAEGYAEGVLSGTDQKKDFSLEEKEVAR
jgi:prepilin-type N-terminal cleavage/methylation domain-containing protein